MFRNTPVAILSMLLTLIGIGVELRSEEPKKTRVQLWFKGTSIDSFVQLDQTGGLTLSEWSRREGAKTVLPDQQGHFVLYRHASPDGNSVMYWFGPFSSVVEAGRAWQRSRDVADRLRKVDPRLYATARAVRVYSPDDAYIRDMVKHDPEAFDLAWVMEQLRQLEEIELTRQKLAALTPPTTGLDTDAKRIEATLEGARRRLREAELMQKGAVDAQIAYELFGEQRVLPSQAAEYLRLEVLTDLARRSGSGVSNNQVLREGVSADQAKRLEQAVSQTLRSAGAQTAEVEVAVKPFREAVSEGRHLTATELSSALGPASQLLFVKLATREGAAEQDAATRALPVSTLDRIRSGLSRMPNSDSLIETMNRAMRTQSIDPADAQATGKARAVPSAAAASLLSGANSMPRSASTSGSAAAAPADDMVRQLNQMLTGVQSNNPVALDVSAASRMTNYLSSAYGPSETARMLAEAGVSLTSLREAGISSEQSKRLIDRMKQRPESVVGAALATEHARSMGVDTSAALAKGLNGAAADAFSESVRRATRDMIVREAEAITGRSFNQLRTSGMSGKNFDAAMQELSRRTGVSRSQPGGAVSSGGASDSVVKGSQIAQALDAMASKLTATMVRNASAATAAGGTTGSQGAGGNQATGGNGSPKLGTQQSGPPNDQVTDSGSPGMSPSRINQILGSLGRLNSRLGGSAQAGVSTGSDKNDGKAEAKPAGSSSGGTGKGDSGPIELRRIR